MRKSPKSLWTLVILLIIGSIIGTLVGQSLKDVLPFLQYGQSIGLNTTTIDLAALNITFGFMLHLNIAGIIGFFLALIVYSRL